MKNLREHYLRIFVLYLHLLNLLFQKVFLLKNIEDFISSKRNISRHYHNYYHYYHYFYHKFKSLINFVNYLFIRLKEPDGYSYRSYDQDDEVLF